MILSRLKTYTPVDTRKPTCIRQKEVNDLVNSCGTYKRWVAKATKLKCKFIMYRAKALRSVYYCVVGESLLNTHFTLNAKSGERSSTSCRFRHYFYACIALPSHHWESFFVYVSVPLLKNMSLTSIACFTSMMETNNINKRLE